MRNFIRNTLQFILLLSSIIIIPVVLITIWNKYIYTEEYFKLPEETRYVAFGHSHTSYSLNDSLINYIANCGLRGEEPFYTKMKIGRILNSNKQIKTVFVSFTNHSIALRTDTNVASKLYLQWFIPHFSPLMKLSDFKELCRYNKSGVINILPQAFFTSLKNNFLYSIKKENKNPNILGGYYYNTDVTHIKELNDNPNEEFVFESAETSLESISSIVDQCKKMDVMIIFVRFPLHKKAKIRLNEQYFQEIRTSMFGDVEFLDFVDFPISNHEFGDLNHLNHKGARKFSIFFNELLENGLLEKEDKQAFIEEKMVKYASKYYTDKTN